MCDSRYWRLLFPLLALLPFAGRAAHAGSPPVQVVLQLKWFHQFQFAGYYAAIQQGFYRDEGLSVEVREGAPDRIPVDVLLAGKADFAVSDADALLARMRGKPVVALATIYQHSPFILVTHDRRVNRPSDLIGRKVMIGGEQGTALFKAMFLNEGIPPERIRFLQHTWRLDDVFNGSVDAASSYATDDYLFRQKGLEPGVIRPAEYGIDFYGDTLFTTASVIAQHPERVAAFRRASLKGWEYAMEHVDGMIDAILAMPGVRERGITREFLVREAGVMRTLILPEVVEIGHMNPARWEQIARTFAKTGVHSGPYTLEGFLYDPNPKPVWPRVAVWAGGTAVLLAGLAGLWILQLRRLVRNRTADLLRSEERYRRLFEHSPVAIWEEDCSGVKAAVEALKAGGVGDLDAYFETHSEELARCLSLIRVNRVNAAALAFYRAKDEAELMARLPETFTDRSAAFFRKALSAIGSRSTGATGEVTRRTLDGSTITVHSTWSAAPGSEDSYAVVYLSEVDVSGQKALEEQLRVAQKMEAIGRLAGGVAHDFNNLLTVINGYAELALAKSPPDGPFVGYLGGIRKAGESAASLTRQLLAFSRRQVLQPETIDVGELVGRMERLLRRVVGEDIRIVTRFAPGLWPINADPGQIEQVLMNLAVNARDAMPFGGRITVEAENLSPGEGVLLSFADDGAGMDEDTRKQMFEPFFTTKEVGKGTGLGLSTVLGIVEQSGGRIDVASQPGEGTTFRIVFPRHRGGAATANGEPPGTAPPAIGGTVLLVEDEDAVRDFVADVLGNAGMKVLEARDGADALRVAAETERPIRLLLTDVVMPEMDGIELANRLGPSRPAMKILYMSGHIGDAVGRRGILDGQADFLQKPFGPNELADRVRRVLEAPV